MARLVAVLGVYTSQSLRDRHYLTNDALVSPEHSALNRMLLSRNDMAYIDCLCLDVDTFEYVMMSFLPVWTNLLNPKVVLQHNVISISMSLFR